MKQYTIYDHPSDFPDAYVVRGWTVVKGQPPIPDPLPLLKRDNLEQCRWELQKKGLICIPRSKGDDPVIIETWI